MKPEAVIRTPGRRPKKYCFLLSFQPELVR